MRTDRGSVGEPSFGLTRWAVPTRTRDGVHGAEGGEDGQLRKALSAVAKAVEQAPAGEVCFAVPAAELPVGGAPTGADRLLACTEASDEGDLVMTSMLHHEM